MDRELAIELLKQEKDSQAQFVNMSGMIGIDKEYTDEGRATIEALDLAIDALNETMSACYLAYKGVREQLQLSGETSTVSEKESVEGDAETATTTDCISREWLVEEIARRDTTDGTVKVFGGREVNEIIRNAPSVTPTERAGWIPCTKEGLALTELMRREGKKWYGYRCTNCNFIYKGNALTESRYCQGCGAKMGEIDNE